MRILFTFLLLLVLPLQAQEFNVDPTPQINDKTDAHSLKRINKILNDARRGTNPLSVGAPPASEAHIGVTTGAWAVVAVEIVRPTDAAPYAAKDVISNSTTTPAVVPFANLARINAGAGYIVKARLMTDLKTFTARIRVHLYNVAPTAINDNAPFLLLYANAANRLGYFDFNAAFTEDPTNSTAATSLRDDLRLFYHCAAGSRTIYAVYEILDAATPATGQKFWLELSADNN